MMQAAFANRSFDSFKYSEYMCYVARDWQQPQALAPREPRHAALVVAALWVAAAVAGAAAMCWVWRASKMPANAGSHAAPEGP